MRSHLFLLATAVCTGFARYTTEYHVENNLLDEDLVGDQNTATVIEMLRLYRQLNNTGKADGGDRKCLLCEND